jgi:putative acetyltransferase
VRAARADDAATILAVVAEAFSGDGRDGTEEVGIVRGTWAATKPRERIELVAVEEAAAGAGGTVVGHVLAAPGRLDGRVAAVGGVAPVCVAPSCQRRGVGSALVRALLGEAAERGWSALLLLGDPAYYGRFGFVPTGPSGLTYPPAGPANPNFMVRSLAPEAEGLHGRFSYVWE